MLCYRQDTFLERVSVHSSEAERAACRKARIVSWSAKTRIAPTAMNLYSGRSCCGLFQETLRHVAQLLFPRSTCVVEQPVPSLRASLPYQPVGVCRRLHQLRLMCSDVEMPSLRIPDNLLEATEGGGGVPKVSRNKKALVWCLCSQNEELSFLHEAGLLLSLADVLRAHH